MNRFLSWLQDVLNRLRDWEKRHCVRVRARKLRRHVFVDGQPGWYTLLGLLAAWWVPLWLFTTNPEVHMRWTGMLLQIGGVGTVAWGLSKTLQLFGKPNVLDSVVQWIGAFPRLLRKGTGQTVRLGFSENITVGHDMSVSTLKPKPQTVEAQIEWLIERIEKQKRRIHKLEQQAKEQTEILKEKVQQETSERASEDDRINQHVLEEVAIGGLHLEFMGVVWLVVGIVLSSFPAELGGVLSLFA